MKGGISEASEPHHADAKLILACVTRFQII